MRVKTRVVKNKPLTWGQKKKIKRARTIDLRPPDNSVFANMFGSGRQPIAQIRRR